MRTAEDARRDISTKATRLQALAELSESEMRAVRDDRIAVTDDLYRLLESDLDPLALRTEIFAHMSLLIAEALDATVDRARAELRDLEARLSTIKPKPDEKEATT